MKCQKLRYIVLVSFNSNKGSMEHYDVLELKLLWNKLTEWSKITLNITRYLIYVLLLSPSPKFYCFTLRPTIFELHATTHCDKCEICFALRPTPLEMRSILRHVHRMTPKWHWTLQSQRHLIFVILFPPNPKFIQFRSTVSRLPDNCNIYFSIDHNLKFKF